MKVAVRVRPMSERERAAGLQVSGAKRKSVQHNSVNCMFSSVVCCFMRRSSLAGLREGLRSPNPTIVLVLSVRRFLLASGVGEGDRTHLLLALVT